jgi:hypothetical protein
VGELHDLVEQRIIDVMWMANRLADH